MNMRVIEPKSSIAVIGGGQLGRMFIQAAHRLGYDAGTLSPTADAPATHVASWVVVGPSDRQSSLAEIARKAKAVSVEFENVSAAGLRWLARRGVVVRPGWRTLWISQNRLREKTFLAEHGVPTAPWRQVHNQAELDLAVRELGLPLILKTADSGYDGKGQVRIDAGNQAKAAWESLQQAPCVAEGFVEFAAEISVVTARGADGKSVAYPPALNRHRNHILDSTMMPAPVGPIVCQEAQQLALGIAQSLENVGVLTVEFFLTSSGDLIVNELAPRPHNSGHLTIESAVTDQFEQQVRALCGLPLGGSTLVQPAAMVNLLGDLWSNGEPRWADALALDPGVRLHLYGKQTAVPGRKMGHLTVLDPIAETALDRATAARAVLLGRKS